MFLNSIIRFIRNIDITKTLKFNFHYFDFRTAIKTPVFIYRHTLINAMDGKIILDAPLKRGMLRIGVRCKGIHDCRYDRTVWEQRGTLVLAGEDVFWGSGSKVCIGTSATLKIGRNFCNTAAAEIICQKEMTFGDNCLISWDVLIMDSDFHRILDKEGNVTNSPESVTLGNHVWVGCRSMILKGVRIGDNSIISAGSSITSSFEEGNCIIAGQGKSARIVRHDANWQ